MNKEESEGPLGYTVSQWRLFSIVLVIGLSGLFFHILKSHRIESSAALYIGLPFLFALGLSLTPKTKSTMGATMKGLSIALFLSAPILMEGFICILMASPILYSVAALFAWFVDRAKKKNDMNSKVQLSILTIMLAAASLEGTHQTLSFERNNTVEYSRIVTANIESIRENLSQPFESKKPRPLFLKVFPFPVSMTGNGLNIDDERHLNFIYKKWVFANAHKGSTTFRITHSEKDYIRFDIPHDDSYLSHYLTWKASEVLLESIDDDTTKITWRLSYKRKLDPAWYFGPMQHYAAWLTAQVLIDNAADPTL